MAGVSLTEKHLETLAHHLPSKTPFDPEVGRSQFGHRVVLWTLGLVLTAAHWSAHVSSELGSSGHSAPATSALGEAGA